MSTIDVILSTFAVMGSIAIIVGFHFLHKQGPTRWEVIEAGDKGWDWPESSEQFRKMKENSNEIREKNRPVK